MARRIIGIIIEVLGAFALMFTVIPPVMKLVDPNAGAFAHVIVAIVLTAGYVVLIEWLARGPVGRRALKIHSRRFAKFYADWYSQSGRVYIFCDDTDWLEGEDNRPIVNALIAKGSRASLFVRITTGSAVKELEQNGVLIVSIPATVSFRARLSLRVEDGKKDLIIRDTNLESSSGRAGRNIFRETSDPYLVGLAEDLLRSIKSDVVL